MYKNKEELIEEWYENLNNCILIPIKDDKNSEVIVGISENIIDISYIYCINGRWDISVEYRINGSKKINLIKDYIKNETLYNCLLDSIKYEVLYTILKTTEKRKIEIDDNYEKLIIENLNKIFI